TAVQAERSLLAALEAGCAAPLGALAEVVEGDDGDELFMRTVVASPDGVVTVRRSITGPVEAADRLGKELAAALLEEGVAELVPQRPPPRSGVGRAVEAAAPVTPREGDL
ncbi:MAG TPA: hypothetical protein VHN80_17560, partial [Kineosporiaceae bacterium]|nr:hypothetical protein [Kineosporiaceae bacterium]